MFKCKHDWQISHASNVLQQDEMGYPHSCWSDFWGCEVIDNIFDNPELLEVK